MITKLISVIVTFYNREDFLEECLLSIQKQTYHNFEVIMVDDGSTDKSTQIAAEFEKNDNRFKLIASEHIGFPLAKNLGLSQISGDYIIFLDSDDSAYPCWLELLYKVATDSNADIIACGFDRYTTQKADEPDINYYMQNPLYIEEFNFLKMNLLFHRECSSFMWNKLVKKELYKDLIFKDQIALSDVSEMYKVFDKANKVILIHTPLVHYRNHAGSMGITTSKQGLDYYKFRMSVWKKLALFVWDNYPQSRYAVQMALKYELKYIYNMVGKEAFYKNFYCKELHSMLNAKIPLYLSKG